MPIVRDIAVVNITKGPKTLDVTLMKQKLTNRFTFQKNSHT